MQELNIRQIDEAITQAVEKHIPLTISINNGGWVNLHSRFLGICEEHILVEPPTKSGGEIYEFSLAEKIALSFKLKHHKYLSNARVAGPQDIPSEEETEIGRAHV